MLYEISVSVHSQGIIEWYVGTECQGTDNRKRGG